MVYVSFCVVVDRIATPYDYYNVARLRVDSYYSDFLEGGLHYLFFAMVRDRPVLGGLSLADLALGRRVRLLEVGLHAKVSRDARSSSPIYVVSMSDDLYREEDGGELTRYGYLLLELYAGSLRLGRYDHALSIAYSLLHRDDVSVVRHDLRDLMVLALLYSLQVLDRAVDRGGGYVVNEDVSVGEGRVMDVLGVLAWHFLRRLLKGLHVDDGGPGRNARVQVSRAKALARAAGDGHLATGFGLGDGLFLLNVDDRSHLYHLDADLREAVRLQHRRLRAVLGAIGKGLRAGRAYEDGRRAIDDRPGGLDDHVYDLLAVAVAFYADAYVNGAAIASRRLYEQVVVGGVLVPFGEHDLRRVNDGDPHDRAERLAMGRDRVHSTLVLGLDHDHHYLGSLDHHGTTLCGLRSSVVLSGSLRFFRATTNPLHDHPPIAKGIDSKGCLFLGTFTKAMMALDTRRFTL